MTTRAARPDNRMARAVLTDERVKSQRSEVVLKQGLSVPLAAGNLLPILFLGMVNTGIGGYLYFSAIGDLPVQTVAICGYLEPLSALFFSAAFLGKSLSVVQGVGAVLILGGAVVGELFREH